MVRSHYRPFTVAFYLPSLTEQLLHPFQLKKNHRKTFFSIQNDSFSVGFVAIFEFSWQQSVFVNHAHIPDLLSLNITWFHTA